MSRAVVLHVIAGLPIGGAETMLLQLVQHLDGWEHHVLTLQPGVPNRPSLRAALQSAGAIIHDAGMPPHPTTPRAAARLLKGAGHILRVAQRLRPTLLHGWMYHGNLATALASLAAPATPYLWSIHNAAPDLPTYRLHTRWVAQLNARLCQHAARVVYVAQSSAAAHAAKGFARARGVHIPGGVDITAFCPQPDAANLLRQRLAIPADAPILGMVARLDPLKDPATFLAAAARLHHPSAHFVLAGPGMVPVPPALRGVVVDAARVHFLPPQQPVIPLLAGLTLCTLSSHSEAFPMVLLEAMACGTPCLASDVGDCAAIVGADAVVPPRDPDALVAAWQRFLGASSLAQAQRRAAVRDRVAKRYSLSVMIQAYRQLYAAVTERRSQVSSSLLSSP